MELVSYRDAGMSTYTWFWVNAQRQVVGPFFDSEEEATEWMNQKINQLREQDEQ